MSYEIQKGVPIPTKIRGHRPCQYPFDSMQPGDCFDAPVAERKKVLQSINNWCKTHPGWIFTTRRLQSGATRVWVTERTGEAEPPIEEPTRMRVIKREEPVREPDPVPETVSVSERLRAAAKATPPGTRTVQVR